MSSDDLKDASMLELFQLETEAQIQILNRGLLDLERDTSQSELLETCMRAAHSLKGAARVIALDPSVKVAHALEDCLVAAQQGRVALSPGLFDLLLKGSDLLLRMSKKVDDRSTHEKEEVDSFIQQMSAFSAAGERSGPEDGAQALPQPVQAVLPEDDLSHERDRLIRVAADKLEQLLDSSERSMIEFQRLNPMLNALQQLKSMQWETQTLLTQAHERLKDSSDTQAAETVEQCLTAMTDCHQRILQHIAELDGFTWNGMRRARLLHDQIQALRMRPIGDILIGLQRTVRDLARTLNKQVRFEIFGEQTLVDRDVLDQLEAPLSHLLYNALDHGIESPQARLRKGKLPYGMIRLLVRRQGDKLLLELTDDGCGIDVQQIRDEVVARGIVSKETVNHLTDQELMTFLFLPGFTLTRKVTEISGRGIGLDVVQHSIRRLHGDVWVEQPDNGGTHFILEVPLTLSVIRSLVVEIGDEPYAFSMSHVERMHRLPVSDIVQLDSYPHFWHEGHPIRLVSGRQLYDRNESRQCSEVLSVVVVRQDDTLYGIVVDRFIGDRTLVLMPLDGRLGKVPNISAGALLDDGSPVLVLDIEDMLTSITQLLDSGHLRQIAVNGRSGNGSPQKRVLVVDDSLTVRDLARRMLVSAGYHVVLAIDGMDGWNALRSESFDLLITDIDMPRMDGLELVRLVRQDEQLGSLPIMILSYKDREKDKARGLLAGANFYLPKAGFRKKVLLDAVHALIGDALPSKV